MTGEQTICELAACEFEHWRGLVPFSQEAVPDCLEPTGGEGWIEVGGRHLAYGVFRLRSTGGEVWLFTFDDGQVHLIEALDPKRGIDAHAVLDRLGAPEAEFPLPLASRLQRRLGRPDETLMEFVFANRGLALLIGQAPLQRWRVTRVRGFEVMSAPDYRRLFVDLPEPRFFPD